MRISIIGAGYVGLTTGLGFAYKGHEVVFVDVDKKKIDMINKGKAVIYEPGVQEYLEEALQKNLVRGTTSYEDAILNTDITFIAVPTPTRENGEVDITYIESASKSIGDVLKSGKEHIVVVKSTVLPGTTENIVKPIILGVSNNDNVRFAFNPEFLREGKAMYDVLNPDRVVVGCDKSMRKVFVDLYKDFVAPERILFMDIKSAELVKYASNAFLSMKISFANLIGRVAKRLNVDVYEVMDAVGMDKRIGREFLNAGLGFGGSCFPKDVKGLSKFMEDLGVDSSLLKDVLAINETQIDEVIELMKQKLGELKGIDVVVLGLSFKPDTDDIRESRAIAFIRRLLEEGVGKVYAHDPVAIDNAKRVLENSRVEYVPSLSEVMDKSDVVVIATEWNHYRDENLYAGKVVFDTRRTIKGTKCKHYEGIAW